MPGEVIDTPNPQALPSHIPDVVEQLQVKLDLRSLEQPACDALFKFRRAASYIAAAMIFLQDNVLLKRNLTHDDIKPRLLGTIDCLPQLATDQIETDSCANFILRPLGNMSRADLGIFTLDLSHQNARPRYALCRRARTWRARHPSLSLAGGLTGEILP
jgi:hypothetical protein